MGTAAIALRMSAGVLVWAAHFAFIYGFVGLACARGFPGPVPWVIGGATLAASLAALAIMVLGYRERAKFESWLMATVAAFALIAILWEGMTVLIVPACG